LQLQLGRLFALQEAYPALKASENFLQLQRDLVAVEEQLQYARRFYNGAVRDYNDGTQRFPDALIARGFGFVGMEFFQAGDDERAPVRVELAK
jgi:LemA protein